MIIIDEQLCKGCDICSDFCPRQVLAVSDAISKRGTYLPAPVREENCVACKRCEMMCPDFAIQVFKQ